MILRTKVLLLVLLFSAVSAAQTADSLDASHQAITIGEKLNFKIRYGFIKAGSAEMHIVGPEVYNGNRLVHIQTTARNLPGFGWIYKVRDEVNAYVDPLTLKPHYFEKILREGTYKADLRVRYGHTDSTAQVEYIRYQDDMSIRKQKQYPVKIPANVYDILSAFYFIRTQPLEVGKSVYLSSLDNKKVYNLEVKVYRRETVEVEAGKFRCLVVEPLLKGEGIFKQKGRLKIWLTDDAYKIPVLMTSEIVIGHITSELVKLEGIDHTIPARLK